MAQRTQTCAFCSAPFTTTHPRKIYCQRKCASDAMNARHNPKKYVVHQPRPCGVCGEIYTPQRSDRLYCSGTCYGKATYAYTPTDNTRECNWCKRTFSPVRSDAFLCSVTCRNYWSYLRDAEKIKQRAAAWSSANPGRRRLIAARNKAHRRGVEVAGYRITDRDWLRLVWRYEGCCAHCGAKTPNPTMDHVIPLSRGGTHGIGNIVPACSSCNLSKNASFVMEWRMRRARALTA